MTPIFFCFGPSRAISSVRLRSRAWFRARVVYGMLQRDTFLNAFSPPWFRSSVFFRVPRFSLCFLFLSALFRLPSGICRIALLQGGATQSRCVNAGKAHLMVIAVKRSPTEALVTSYTYRFGISRPEAQRNNGFNVLWNAHALVLDTPELFVVLQHLSLIAKHRPV